MSAHPLIGKARSGSFLPVYVVVGEERYLRKQFVDALKACVLQGAIAGLNEDEWTAAETDPNKVVAVAKTVPMLSPRRYVCVSEVERWEGKKEDSGMAAFERYLEAPAASTVLVLCADKLHAKNKILGAAKKLGALVSCDPLPKKDLPAWLSAAATSRGCRLDPAAVELIVEVVGSDLSVLGDLVERLCLYLGGSGTITEDTVETLIPVIRPSTVWELVEAVAERNVSRALSSLAKIYDPQDRGLGIVSVLLWSTRQLVAFEAARSSGAPAPEAAKAANVPPFRIGKIEGQLRRLSRIELERWFCVLRDVDLALKGGSRRPAQAILEAAIIQLCNPPVNSAPQKRSA